jgi:hypothetical protein
MYPKRIVRHALGLALSMTLVVCSLSACGGGQEEASKPRPLRGARGQVPKGYCWFIQ